MGGSQKLGFRVVQGGGKPEVWAKLGMLTTENRKPNHTMPHCGMRMRPCPAAACLSDTLVMRN